MEPQVGLPEVLIKRDTDNDPTGPTFGRLKAPGFECDTLERPRDILDHPRINTGSYRVSKFQSPTQGLCFKLEDKDNRTFILIHSANWWRQLQGCIALGRSVQVVEGEWHGEKIREVGLTNSRDAVQAFFDHMEGKDFMLTII